MCQTINRVSNEQQFDTLLTILDLNCSTIFQGVCGLRCRHRRRRPRRYKFNVVNCLVQLLVDTQSCLQLSMKHTKMVSHFTCFIFIIVVIVDGEDLSRIIEIIE